MSDAAAAPRFLIEQDQVFSRSLLWSLQREYFHTRGIGAWQDGEVPQYVTTNPTVANSYAEIALAFFRDRRRLAPNGGEPHPITICELGAGSGRFAFHFLSRLETLCRDYRVPFSSFRYVLTDIVDANLAFFRSHARLKPFFERGVLDTALFDVTSSDTLQLQGSGETIGAGALDEPLIVIANYLFDTVPQDFLHFSGGTCRQGLVSLALDADPATVDRAELLSRAEYTFAFAEIDASTYAEPFLQQLVSDYQSTIADGYVALPVEGLRALERLRQLSKRGLLLLSADRGYDRIGVSRERPEPGLVRHGSFSLEVNYDAFRRHCERQRGLALQPSTAHDSLAVGVFLMVDDADNYVEMTRAFRRHVEEFGPDDFFTVSRYVRRNIAEMSVQEIVACLRLGHYDSTQLLRYLPRLIALAPEMTAGERQAVIDAVDQVWALYFPLGEAADFPFEIARLLYEIDDYRGALKYFERSIEIYGEHASTRGNIRICEELLTQSH